MKTNNHASDGMSHQTAVQIIENLGLELDVEERAMRIYGELLEDRVLEDAVELYEGDVDVSAIQPIGIAEKIDAKRLVNEFDYAKRWAEMLIVYRHETDELHAQAAEIAAEEVDRVKRAIKRLARAIEKD